MSFSLMKSPNCSQRIAFSRKMNGERSGFSRVVDGFTTRSTALSHTLCSLEGLSTISSSRRTRLSNRCSPNENNFSDYLSIFSSRKEDMIRVSEVVVLDGICNSLSHYGFLDWPCWLHFLRNGIQAIQ
ncbi:hypothetical protein NE237_009499 [Protea cynaroides]|uniref:Uncharacterized protein n=1 Tax=Protea cynaroides TaxID=273540 RepID=A0A9Q0R0P8_9MAGN|nr:hypothetical protein NE237_009499 [Protea cynaroides]